MASLPASNIGSSPIFNFQPVIEPITNLPTEEIQSAINFRNKLILETDKDINLLNEGLNSTKALPSNLDFQEREIIRKDFTDKLNFLKNSNEDVNQKFVKAKKLVNDFRVKSRSLTDRFNQFNEQVDTQLQNKNIRNKEKIRNAQIAIENQNPTLGVREDGSLFGQFTANQNLFAEDVDLFKKGDDILKGINANIKSRLGVDIISGEKVLETIKNKGINPKRVIDILNKTLEQDPEIIKLRQRESLVDEVLGTNDSEKLEQDILNTKIALAKKIGFDEKTIQTKFFPKEQKTTINLGDNDVPVLDTKFGSGISRQILNIKKPNQIKDNIDDLNLKFKNGNITSDEFQKLGTLKLYDESISKTVENQLDFNKIISKVKEINSKIKPTRAELLGLQEGRKKLPETKKEIFELIKKGRGDNLFEEFITNIGIGTEDQKIINEAFELYEKEVERLNNLREEAKTIETLDRGQKSSNIQNLEKLTTQQFIDGSSDFFIAGTEESFTNSKAIKEKYGIEGSEETIENADGVELPPYIKSLSKVVPTDTPGVYQVTLFTKNKNGVKIELGRELIEDKDKKRAKKTFNDVIIPDLKQKGFAKEADDLQAYSNYLEGIRNFKPHLLPIGEIQENQILQFPIGNKQLRLRILRTDDNTFQVLDFNGGTVGEPVQGLKNIALVINNSIKDL